MGKKVLTPERKLHLARLKKASRLRAKAEKGGLSSEERQELEALDSLPRSKGGRPRGATKRNDDSDAEAPPAVAEPTGDQGQETEPARHEPPPPPPTVEVIPSKTKGGDWRNRYREEAVGREAACVQMAALYCGILKRMSKYISDSGVTPIMGDAEIDSAVFGAAVLTADKLLPDVDFGPEVQLALGSGLVMSQAMYVAMKKRRVKGSTGGPAWAAPSNPPDGPPTTNIPPAQAERADGTTAVGNVRVPNGKFF